MRDAGPGGDNLSSQRRDQLIETIAVRIKALGLAAPAVLMLEAHLPLSFIGSQAILIAQPLLNVAFNPAASKEIADLLEDRNNVELLIQRLESQESDRA